MVDGYAGSVWGAIDLDQEAIGEPDLIDWNAWQTWRRTDGGLPRGAQDSAVANRENDLWWKAMER